MPQISEKLERCTFFLFGENPKTGEMEIGGTGCIVMYNIGVKVPSFYAVTNWHVVTGGASNIRLNLYPDGSEIVKFDPSEWTLIKDYDLAVIDITENIAEEKHLVAAIGLHQFVDQFAVEHDELYIGDDVFMMGLFSNYYHDDKNTPVARFGNICRPEERRYPVTIEGVTETPCHLVDMRSRPGHSGSPVWIYRTPATDLSDFHAGGGPIDMRQESSRGGRTTEHAEWAIKPNNTNMFLRFLGIHSSQFQERIRAEVVKSGERIGDHLKEGDNLSIPSSVTIVIPSYRIAEVLTRREIVDKRIQRDEEYLRNKESETG